MYFRNVWYFSGLSVCWFDVNLTTRPGSRGSQWGSKEDRFTSFTGKLRRKEEQRAPQALCPASGQFPLPPRACAAEPGACRVAAALAPPPPGAHAQWHPGSALTASGGSLRRGEPRAPGRHFGARCQARWAPSPPAAILWARCRPRGLAALCASSPAGSALGTLGEPCGALRSPVNLWGGWVPVPRALLGPVAAPLSLSVRVWACGTQRSRDESELGEDPSCNFKWRCLARMCI